MKIIFYTGGGIAAPHIINSAAKACKSLGHDVRMFPVTSAVQKVCPLIKEFNPDLVIALDHTGISDSDFSENRIYYCSWFVDHPLYFTESSNFGNYHLALVSDRSFEPALKKMGCRHVIHCPLAYDPDIFFPDEKVSNAEYASDMVYVGSFPGMEQELSRERRQKFRPVINELVDSCINIVTSDSSVPVWEALHMLEKIYRKKFLSVMSDQSIGGIIKLVDNELDARNKRLLFETFKTDSFRIYGDDGWRKLALDTGIYRGAANYEKELPGLYRRTKINIVLTRPQIAAGVNQRVFDISAVKGFMLCDYRKELEEIFPDTWPLVSFKNFEELRKKAAYYIVHEQEREEISRNLFNAVKNRHTYEARMKTVLAEISEITGK